MSGLQSQAQEVVKVVRAYSSGSYGPIEIKHHHDDIWKPLSAGLQLAGDDWVRMPPASLLLLEPLDGGKLPTFAGGQMRTVAQFLLLATDTTPPPSISPTGKPLIVGAIPKAADVSARQETSPKPQYHAVTEQQVQQIVALVPEADETMQAFLKGIEAQSPYQNILNLGKALWLFDHLQQVGIDIKEPATQEATPQSPRQTLDLKRGNAIDYALLYYTLLTMAKIPVQIVTLDANLELTSRGLLIKINSGISRAEMPKITVNPRLVEGDKELWAPLYITPLNSNFVQAWYRGAMICRRRAQNSSPE
jgi:hypothetical protein